MLEQGSVGGGYRLQDMCRQRGYGKYERGWGAHISEVVSLIGKLIARLLITFSFLITLLLYTCHPIVEKNFFKMVKLN